MSEWIIVDRVALRSSCIKRSGDQSRPVRYNKQTHGDIFCSLDRALPTCLNTAALPVYLTSRLLMQLPVWHDFLRNRPITLVQICDEISEQANNLIDKYS